MENKINNRLLAVQNQMFEHVAEQSNMIVGSLVNYKELMMMYSCAIREVETKLNILDTEYNVRYEHNPISSITTRLKSTSSIMEKMKRLNIPVSADNIEQNIEDIAGIRVICCYIDDIYAIAENLSKQDDIEVIKRKDYIQNPKESGYRSLHLIVTVPVFLSDQTKKMKVEIQIRTIAMDFWASLEHQIKYKKDVTDPQIIQRLCNVAETIHQTDEEMLAIRKDIDAKKKPKSMQEELFSKLSKIDLSFDK